MDKPTLRARPTEGLSVKFDDRAQHTPGPWLIATSNSWRRIVSTHRGMTHVCEPITQNDGHPDLYFKNGGPDGPDAKLIEAAPDLLTSCRELLAQLELLSIKHPQQAAVRQRARAAIEKAGG